MGSGNIWNSHLIINKSKKIELMSNLLYFVAIILVIAWAIGFVGYNVGGIVHILLVIAIIAVIFRLIKGERI